jgi:Zn finger protein HypA/HybF involved in hydrogenase expression
MNNIDGRLTVLKCWSCHAPFTLGQYRDNDGLCPGCNAEQDDGQDDDDGPADGYRGDNW